MHDHVHEPFPLIDEGPHIISFGHDLDTFTAPSSLKVGKASGTDRESSSTEMSNGPLQVDYEDIEIRWVGRDLQSGSENNLEV